MTRATMLAKKKALELSKKKDAEEKGDHDGWDEDDGDTVYRRGMMLGNKRMIVSVDVLKHAVNGVVRLRAHDPETCSDYSVLISYFDTRSVTSPPRHATTPQATDRHRPSRGQFSPKI